ncbi:hemolymph clottable protein-like [Oratosquilla oratoria]|uniref:hemolymph clottable protein-like n=1 Tax=Oratosquilla oratoria TaxID=337810 RepID=UPI003F75C54F
MKTSPLLLLLLTGLASALQPGLEYEYLYQSRIATGIPDLNRQYAGASIRASVTVQLLGEDLMAQISNIEVADMNGLIECDSRAPLPLNYEPLVDHVEVFQEPFLIKKNHSLAVPEDEPLWITNIRKAVATLFTVKPLRTHENEHEGLLQTEVFETPFLLQDEESLAGICEHRYVLTKLPDYLKEEHFVHMEEILEEDVQSDLSQHTSPLKSKSKGGHGKGSKGGSKGGGSKGASKGGRLTAPKLGDDVFVLTRTINFDKCQNLVRFQTLGAGGDMFCSMGSSQCGTVLSRSSTGSFYLRGSSEALRIERVEIEGNILLNPLGYETEKIRTVTNQTLELKMVRYKGTPLELPASTRPVDSFMYEIDSQKEAGFLPNNIIAGRSSQDVSKEHEYVVNQVHILLMEAVNDLDAFAGEVPESRGDIAKRFSVLTQLIMSLDYDELKAIYDTIDTSQDYGPFAREMLIDVMARAGTHASVMLLVEQFRNHAFQSERAAEVFAVFAISLQNPDQSLPLLFEVLEGLEVNQEFDLVSTLLISLISATSKYGADCHMLSLKGCLAYRISNQIMSFVKEQFQNEKDDDRKHVYIHALASLYSSEKFEFLKSIILGDKKDENTRLIRTSAIYMLYYHSIPAHEATEVFNLLMSLFEDKEQFLDIRLAAVQTLKTWSPGPDWWHRMAIASWRDPSPWVQAFVSEIIKSTAETTHPYYNTQRQYASHVLSMARSPVTSLPNVGIFDHSLDKDTKISWFENKDTFFVMDKSPFYLYKLAMAQHGTFVNILFEILASVDKDMWKTLFGKEKEDILVTKDRYARLPKNIYAQTLMSLRMDEYTHFENSEHLEKRAAMLFLLKAKIFNLQRMFTRDSEMLSKLTLQDIPSSWKLSKFICPVQLSVSFPTDVGLPFIGSVSTPIILHSNGHLNLQVEDHAEAQIKMNAFMSLEVQTKTQVATPWNGRAITSGIELMQDIMLPLAVKASVDTTNRKGTFSVTIVEQKKVSLMKRYNYPFTVRASLVPYKPLSAEEDYRIIKQHQKPFQDHHDLGKQYTGMALNLEWEGDFESPFNFPSLVHFLSAPPERKYYYGFSPTLQHYEYSITFDPDHSDTSTFTTSIAVVTTEKEEDAFSQVSQGDFTQYGQDKLSQQSGDYGDVEDFQQFQEAEFGSQQQQSQSEDGSQYSTLDSSQERMDKIKKHHQQMESTHVQSISSRFEFSGSLIYRYDTVLTWISGEITGDLEKILSEAQVTVLSGTDIETKHRMCIDMKSLHPYLSHMMDLSDTLEHDLMGKLDLELRVGSCTGPAILQSEVSVDMSQLRKDNILSVLASEYCASDLMVNKHALAVHDKAHIHINWDEDLMECLPLTNLTYHANDLVQSLLFPHVTHNYCHAENPPREVDITATRSIDTNLWTVWVHRPTDVSVIDHLNVPKIIDQYVSLDPDHRHISGDKMLPLNLCHIYEDHVVTFNGLDYSLERSPCWRVLAMDVDHFESWMLLYRYTQYPEPGTQLRFIHPKGSVIADITSTEVKVNGKPVVMAQNREVVRHERRTLCTVEMYNDKVYVEFPDILSVAMKNSHIAVKVNSYGVSGLCGRRNHDTTHTFEGPNKCIYHNPELFALAWMAGGDGDCDPYSFEDLLTKVEDYQKHCPLPDVFTK